jgi:hypothetical protein
MTYFDEITMKAHVDAACKDCVANGAAIAMAQIPVRYRDGAVVAPLRWEPDEFCGVWFVRYGLAVNGRFVVRRLDLGQARFRFACEGDVQHPEGVRPNTAEVRRDALIEALDQRFGPDHVHIYCTPSCTSSSDTQAMQVCQRLWPLSNPIAGGLIR